MRSSSSPRSPSSASIDNVVPQVYRAMELVVEPRITDAAWYLAASPDQVDTIEYDYLEGAPASGGPTLETREGWDIDGQEYKAREEFTATPIDCRGLVKNPGRYRRLKGAIPMEWLTDRELDEFDDCHTWERGPRQRQRVSRHARRAGDALRAYPRLSMKSARCGPRRSGCARARPWRRRTCRGSKASSPSRRAKITGLEELHAA